MAEPARAEIRYTAFLSYSHKDAAAAARLHRRLEAYRVPKRLVGTETPRGPVPRRLWPIFRDREELPAASDLSETVRTALGQSGSLIILCSPSAAASLWVAEEIETFRKLHPDRPILAAILDGDPPDCFPPALRAFGRDGTWHEPLATDLRPKADGRHLGLLKLVAGITGLGLDDLVQRDAARRVRRVMTVTVGAVAAMLIMAALAVVAVQARREADRQRAEAEGLVEFMLTDLREKLRGAGRIRVMQAVNERALTYYGGQGELSRLSAESLDRRARVLHAIGEDENTRGHRQAALTAFREAHRTTEALLAQAPNDPARIFAHSQSEFWIASIPYYQRNNAAARPAFQRYKSLVDRLIGIDPDNPAWIEESGYAEGSLCAIALADPPNVSDARNHCFASLARVLQVHRLRPDDLQVTLAVANHHAWAADVCKLLGRWDLALAHRARQEELARLLIAREPDNADFQDFWMSTQFTFAQLLAGHGQRESALQWIDAARSTNEMLRARDGDNARWVNWGNQIANAADALR